MKLTLDIQNTNQLANICGSLNKNLDNISKILDVNISNNGVNFNIDGENSNIAVAVIKDLANNSNNILEAKDIELSIQAKLNDYNHTESSKIKLPLKYININNCNQNKYIEAINKKDIVFGIGPAGTGKTYLAVAKAVQNLEDSNVKRLVLVRPAVEAGERLGFLPGDLNEKIDPYLRPIYDALYDFIGFEKVSKLIDKNIIEIAPLAFMRGRTINDAFIILDEAQNTTKAQMKMFLTRMGFGSKIVITGDLTQIDLEKPTQSGLLNAINIIKNEKQIAFCYFVAKDVIKHNLVQRIVTAYEKNNG